MCTLSVRASRALGIVTHVFTWIAYAYVFIAVCVQTGAARAYVWHGLCMVTAYLLLMTLGVIEYRAGRGGSALRSQRIAHALLQHTAALLALLALAVKMADNSLSRPPRPTLPSGWHAVLGVVTIALTLLMVLFGFIKYQLGTKQPPWMKAHGWLGLLTWLCGLVNVASGLTFVLHDQHTYSIAPALYAPAIALMGIVVVLVLVLRFAGVRIVDYEARVRNERTATRQARVRSLTNHLAPVSADSANAHEVKLLASQVESSDR